MDALVIDWCYDCAERFCKSSLHKMFVWITISLLRICTNYSVYDADGCITLAINLKTLEENSAIKEYVYDAEFYKGWVKEIFKNSLILFGAKNIDEKDITDAAIDKNNIFVVWRKPQK